MANSINGVICNFDEVLLNRKRFLKKVGVDINKTVCMRVTHGDEITEADSKTAGVSMTDYRKVVKVDGLITNKKGLYLFLLIADCLPIIIYDPVKKAIALVHAGWKGVDLDIAGKAILQFKSKFKSKPKDLIVGIGPFVHKESFIKEDPFQKNDLRWRDFMVRIKGDMYEVDLVDFAKKQLIESGVLKENIFESGINTAKDGRFFSHVRDGNLPIGQQGRFACIVGLSPTS